MKFVSAVTALVAALAVGSEAAKPKNKRVSRRELNQRMQNGQFDKATIVKNAKPHSPAAKKRALDEGMQITGNYSVQFQSCFSLTTSYEELFEDGDEGGGSLMNLFSQGNVMAMESYAIFRLCYGNNCNANGNEALLEYVVDLNTYVQSLVNYLPEQMEGFCEACVENYDNCVAILYGQYGQNYQYGQNNNNPNAYRYQSYSQSDNNYNGNNVNYVNYDNGQYGMYGNYGQNNGNRKLFDFEQRVLNGGQQVVRQLDCQLCEEYNCLSGEDDNNNQQNEEYGFEAASEWLQEIAQCYETGASYYNGYNNYNNGGGNNNDDNDLYAGMICNGDGTGVEIGIFYDEECKLYLPNEPFTNYMSYYDQTYQAMTKEIIEFTFSDAVFSCKEQEVVYTTQDLSQYGGNYNGNYNYNGNNNDADDISEWCEDLVSGEVSTPVDMSTCGMYNAYTQYGNQQNAQYYDSGSYQERYDNYQQNNDANQYQYQYDWYRYEISEDDSLEMSEVCKVAKRSGGTLHTFFNTNNPTLYSYGSGSNTATIDEFLEGTQEGQISYMQQLSNNVSGAAKFGIVAAVGIAMGAIVALFLRFKTMSEESSKQVDLLEADEKGEIA